jgi:transcriptional regulator with XRE-family HTH domain
MTMKKTRPEKLTDQLRRIVASCGKTLGQIARDTGIDKTALSRFLNGERGVSCAVMDTLGEYFGLRIVADKPQAKKGR